MSTFIFFQRKKEPEGSCRDFGLYLADVFVYCGAVSAIDGTRYQCAELDGRQ